MVVGVCMLNILENGLGQYSIWRPQLHSIWVYLYLCVSQLVFTVVIPNAKAIEAARRKRQAARGQKEFISLGRDGHSSAGSTPDHYSREDDEDRVDDDDEPDDHERRIEFAPRLKSIRERIAEKLGMKEWDWW